MKNSLLAGAVVALSALACLLPGDEAVAGTDRSSFAFGGKWDVTLDTPLGMLDVTVKLQPNGKGKLWLPMGGGHVPVVHQFTDTMIAWTIELPAVQAPDANGHTILGRGTLAEDGSISGNIIIVTLKQDAESPVGYETHTGSFAATRKGQ